MSFFGDYKELVPKPSKTGMQVKFVVMKVDDINQVLAEHEIDNLVSMMDSIARYRNMLGKPENEYVVINVDEPYFPEVKAIMERNGHWG